MEILVYRRGEQKVQEGITVDQLPGLLKDESVVIWVDMESPTSEDEQVLLDVFKFHPLTVEDCRENRHYPKVEEFPGYIYFIVHGVRGDTSPDRFNTIELDGFLGSNYVITYHHDSFRSIDDVKQLLRTSPVGGQRGPAFLMHQILDHVVDYYRDFFVAAAAPVSRYANVKVVFIQGLAYILIQDLNHHSSFSH